MPLVTVRLAALVLVFALWWLYFLAAGRRWPRLEPRALLRLGLRPLRRLRGPRRLGAGLEVAVEHSGDHVAASAVAVAYAVAVPVAVFLTLVWALHVPIVAPPVLRATVTLGGAAAILLLPLASLYIPLAAVVASIATACALVVGATVVLDQRVSDRAQAVVPV